MMTHDQQVRDALKVLVPDKNDRAQCMRDVEHALEEIYWASLDPRPNNKDVRKAVRELLAALRNCQMKFNALHRLDEAHAHELMMAPLDFSNHIAAYTEWLAEPTDKPRRRAAKNKCAVKEARVLVLKYCKRKQDRSVTRRNAWYKLSAIFAGDKTLNLLNHMRLQK